MSLFTGVLLVDLVGVLVAVLATTFAYLQWNSRYWKRKNVPYIEPKFPFGKRPPLLKPVSLGIEVFDIVKEAKEKGWTNFGIFMSAKPFFVTLDLEIAKCILTKDFHHFTDRGIFYNEKDDPLSAHLFAISNPKWRQLRTKLTPTFTSGKMRGMFQTLLDCGLLLEKTLKEHDSKEPIEIKHVLVCFTTDIIGSCAFGLECNSFKEPDSLFIKYGRQMFRRSFAQKLVTIMSMTFPKLALALHAKIVPSDVTTFFHGVVRKTVEYREKNKYSRNDFLQLLIEIKNENNHQEGDTKEEGSGLTMDEIAAQCFVFFLAGFETSSSTVTFTLFELSQHAEIQEKVRQELFGVLKKYDNKLCYDAVKELEYMQQVIDETLRKYPAVPLLFRKCVQEYKIPNTEIILEKNSGVIIPVRNIHYDENIYEDPEKFDPDRFSHDNKQKRHQYSHLPFGEGPRNCIGMRFGLMQSKVALAIILSKFRVKLNPKTKLPLDMDPRSFVPATKEGVWLDLEEIKV